MCVVSYLLFAVSMCFVHRIQPTAEPAKMARIKTNNTIAVPAIGPLMLYQFAKLPAISMLLAYIRIHARLITILKTVKNELKNKSNVFIFLRDYAAGGLRLLLYVLFCVHQHHARDGCDLVRCKQLPGRRARCCVVSCCLTMQKYCIQCNKPNKTALKTLQEMYFNN